MAKDVREPSVPILVLPEALGIRHAALQTPEVGSRFDKCQNINSVMPLQPFQLALMLLHHFYLLLERIRDIHVFGGQKIHADNRFLLPLHLQRIETTTADSSKDR